MAALAALEAFQGLHSAHACDPALVLYVPGAQAAQLQNSLEKPARHQQPTASLPGAESASALHNSQRDRSSDA